MIISEAFQRRALAIIGERKLAKAKKSPRWQMACASAIERLPLNAPPPPPPHISYIIRKKK